MFFKEVIGQENIKRRLINGVRENRVAHAQLFIGAAGYGCLPMALAYAQYLCCENRSDTDSCGVCPACRQILKLAFADLHFVFPIVKKDSKETLCEEYLKDFRSEFTENPYMTLENWQNCIADTKNTEIYTSEGDELIRKLNFKTFQSEYKVAIVWCAEKMNPFFANKVLKLFEEPLGKTVFILITEDEEQLLQTIRSRMQPIIFPPIDNENLRNALLNSGLDFNHNNIDYFIKNARGNWVDLRGNIEVNEMQEQHFELFTNLMRTCWTLKVDAVQILLKTFSDLGRPAQINFLQFAQKEIRENFIYNLKISRLSYMNQDEEDFAKNFSRFINENNVAHLASEFALAEAQIKQNGNAKIIFSDLILKLNRLIQMKS